MNNNDAADALHDAILKLCPPKLSLTERQRAYHHRGFSDALYAAAELVAASRLTVPAAGPISDSEIMLIGLRFQIQAFLNAQFRDSNGQQMTAPEREEYETLIRFARAMAAAPAEPIQAQSVAWMPIKSAPTDGTEVLLLLGAPWNRLATARWYEPWGNWQEGEFPDDSDEYCGIGEAVPTHWMLPASLMNIASTAASQTDAGDPVKVGKLSELTEDQIAKAWKLHGQHGSQVPYGFIRAISSILDQSEG